jgi:hypothetical protein
MPVTDRPPDNVLVPVTDSCPCVAMSVLIVVEADTTPAVSTKEKMRKAVISVLSRLMNERALDMNEFMMLS